LQRSETASKLTLIPSISDEETGPLTSGPAEAEGNEDTGDVEDGDNRDPFVEALREHLSQYFEGWDYREDLYLMVHSEFVAMGSNTSHTLGMYRAWRDSTSPIAKEVLMVELRNLHENLPSLKFPGGFSWLVDFLEWKFGKSSALQH
jgi:hypothetical protein